MRSNDHGSALVMALLIVVALSVIGSALTVLALSETYGSMNYRLMSQARYAAESGVHKVANYLTNTYVVPGAAGDPLTGYDMTSSPVKVNGAPVVLSAMSGVTSNYPISAVVTASAYAHSKIKSSTSSRIRSGHRVVDCGRRAIRKWSRLIRRFWHWQTTATRCSSTRASISHRPDANTRAKLFS